MCLPIVNVSKSHFRRAANSSSHRGKMLKRLTRVAEKSTQSSECESFSCDMLPSDAGRRQWPGRRLPSVGAYARNTRAESAVSARSTGTASSCASRRSAPREITFHDMRAKAASDSDSDVPAEALLHHEDMKVTKRVYRRKVPSSTPHCQRKTAHAL
jgi:integrase